MLRRSVSCASKSTSNTTQTIAQHRTAFTPVLLLADEYYGIDFVEMTSHNAVRKSALCWGTTLDVVSRIHDVEQPEWWLPAVSATQAAERPTGVLRGSKETWER